MSAGHLHPNGRILDLDRWRVYASLRERSRERLTGVSKGGAHFEHLEHIQSLVHHLVWNNGDSFPVERVCLRQTIGNYTVSLREAKCTAHNPTYTTTAFTVRTVLRGKATTTAGEQVLCM